MGQLGIYMKYLNKLIGSTFLLSCLLCNGISYAGEVSVAVAGNFAKPLKVLVEKFESNTGQKVAISVGSTGKLYAQIINGAPFEVFLASDQKRPIKLVERNLAVKSSQFTYAKGKLVLWSKKIGGAELGEMFLSSTELKHLAIADPKMAPYGVQAIFALKNLGLYQQLKDKLIRAQNVGQAYQYLNSGSIEMGIIALSQVTENGKINIGSAWIIPHSLYQPIQQDGVLLEKGKSNPVALLFLDYLKTPEALQIIRSFGYEVDT